MSKNDHTPPRWAQRLLEWYCRPEILEDLDGDLEEYFQRNVAKRGLRHARFIYIIDVLKFIRLYTIRRPKLNAPMKNLIVYQNYLKAAVRNMSRNTLFSIINVVGLAISMTVGLFLIAALLEVKSYDSFHQNYNRIYRINNFFKSGNLIFSEADGYASTSVLAGKKIKEEVTGIKEVLIMCEGFDKDVRVEDKMIPLEGFWANEAFFKIFSFETLHGNSTTALASPNQIVLTESTAKKLFNQTDVVGKMVMIDTVAYSVSAVMKDIPSNSHLQFDMLGSFITYDQQRVSSGNKRWMRWDNMWQNYVYLLLDDSTHPETIQQQLDKINEEGKATTEDGTISITLQPLSKIAFGPELSNELGRSFDEKFAMILGIFALAVILSACFNYANLSIARALRRMKEIGVRKVVGASRGQVFQQFILEAILIAFVSLGISFIIFMLARPGFLDMNEDLKTMVTLQPDLKTYLVFVAFAVAIGVMAGSLPAWYFSKVSTSTILKNASSIKLFRNVSFRKALIIFQFSLSIGFIVAVTLTNRQYQFSLSYDLGLTTENILNIELQKNAADIVAQQFSQLPEVKKISKSLYVAATSTQISGYVRYKNSSDSTTMYYNQVDEHYMDVHGLQLVEGENFNSTLAKANEEQVIINEKMVTWMGLQKPFDAIGEQIRINGKPVTIIGVVKNFHYNRINSPIGPFAFTYFKNNKPAWGGLINLLVQSENIPDMMKKLEDTWKKIDPVHPMRAAFYKDKIQDSYRQAMGIIKVMGALSVLTISIACLGLLGMVVFTTETRVKEIGIRKVLGASEKSLLLLMSKGFLILLLISAAVGVSVSYYIFDQMLFSRIAYRAPIGFLDLFAGVILIFTLALLAIVSQTWRVARSNPATVLKVE